MTPRAPRVRESPEVWARCSRCRGEIQLLGTEWHHPDEAKHAAEPDHSPASAAVGGRGRRGPRRSVTR